MMVMGEGRRVMLFTAFSSRFFPTLLKNTMQELSVVVNENFLKCSDIMSKAQLKNSYRLTGSQLPALADPMWGGVPLGPISFIFMPK